MYVVFRLCVTYIFKEEAVPLPCKFCQLMVKVILFMLPLTIKVSKREKEAKENYGKI